MLKIILKVRPTKISWAVKYTPFQDRFLQYWKMYSLLQWFRCRTCKNACLSSGKGKDYSSELEHRFACRPAQDRSPPPLTKGSQVEAVLSLGSWRDAANQIRQCSDLVEGSVMGLQWTHCAILFSPLMSLVCRYLVTQLGVVDSVLAWWCHAILGVIPDWLGSLMWLNA